MHNLNEQVKWTQAIVGSLTGLPEELAIHLNCGSVGLISLATLTNSKIGPSTLSSEKDHFHFLNKVHFVCEFFDS